MKEVKVVIPDDCHLEKVGGGYIIVKDIPTLDSILSIHKYSSCMVNINYPSQYDSTKLKILGKLLCVADYLNEGWKPDWNNEDEQKWYIGTNKRVIVDFYRQHNVNLVYFKTEELAEKAIQIIGEDDIKTLYS